jgi:hypothetical protein
MLLQVANTGIIELFILSEFGTDIAKNTCSKKGNLQKIVRRRP